MESICETLDICCKANSSVEVGLVAGRYSAWGLFNLDRKRAPVKSTIGNLCKLVLLEWCSMR